MLAVWVAIGVLAALMVAPLLVMAAGLLVAPATDDVAAEPTLADDAPPASVTQAPTPTPGPPAPSTAPAPPSVPADAQQARVVDVVDGDTLTLAALAAGSVLSATDPVRVRLLQIDTPERGAPLADEATAMLGTMAGPGAVLWALRDREPHDRYGRELLYLWTEDGTFVNEAMVRSGLATAVLYEPNDRFIDVMRAAEAEARTAGVGLWSVGEPAAAPAPAPEPEPVPPPPAAPRPLVEAPQAGACEPAYPGICIPPSPPDLDCGDVSPRRFEVRAPDPHRFDADGDGIGCESG